MLQPPDLVTSLNEIISPQRANRNSNLQIVKPVAKFSIVWDELNEQSQSDKLDIHFGRDPILNKPEWAD